MNETLAYLRTFAQLPLALRRFAGHTLTIEDAERIRALEKTEATPPARKTLGEEEGDWSNGKGQKKPPKRGDQTQSKKEKKKALKK